MGNVDRSIRVLAAIVVGVVFLLTSTISFCPLYTPFKISTCKEGATK